MGDRVRANQIHITGVVQGVGFRPFVYSLAEKLRLNGWVRNTSAGVDIVVEGPPDRLAAFLKALWEDTPPLARVENVQVKDIPATGLQNFKIAFSIGKEGDFQPIPPDVSICEDCLRELFDPDDRRYRYPFINCTNCGPRFTIIRDIPYDRPLTTMASFELCPDCAQEYHDPHNRRFHAQPVACTKCGPHVWYEENGTDGEITVIRAEQAIQVARRQLAAGKILAVKGLGGFHLVCDATNPEAVAELRRRKGRPDKPLAVMFPALDVLKENCLLGASGRNLLKSPERPIVILPRRTGSVVSREVAPGQNTIGAMLPYTPLHYLLMEPASWFPEALVMTSANHSEEPIVYTNTEAKKQLAAFVDGFLLHNRDIETRCDDSVVRVFQNHVYPVRRARGYAPFPFSLAEAGPQILASGAELKNTFCLTKSHYAFVSQHIGDLENAETLQAFEQSIMFFEKLFRIVPEVIAHDLHPDYLSTHYAQSRAESEQLPLIPVQHHHAHIVSCMAEHHLPAVEPVIGVAFDGTGYGTDGTIWGGEFLLADYTQFQRAAYLQRVPLPGGDLAVREPWRMALSWLNAAGIPWESDLAPVRFGKQFRPASTEIDSLQALANQLQHGTNAPFTSSAGRLFDAVASLIGLRQTVTYEAQAAIELDIMQSDQEFGVYRFENFTNEIGLTLLFQDIVADLRSGVSSAVISARFHNTLALMIHETCRSIRQQSSARRVVLSGGVWQNMTLLGRTVNLLSNDNFEVYVHQRVPANDGGISLGQAVIALHRHKAGRLALEEAPVNQTPIPPMQSKE
jgi:hydrogenase maturation protein HypF